MQSDFAPGQKTSVRPLSARDEKQLPGIIRARIEAKEGNALISLFAPEGEWGEHIPLLIRNAYLHGMHGHSEEFNANMAEHYLECRKILGLKEKVYGRIEQLREDPERRPRFEKYCNLIEDLDLKLSNSLMNSLRHILTRKLLQQRRLVPNPDQLAKRISDHFNERLVAEHQENPELLVLLFKLNWGAAKAVEKAVATFPQKGFTPSPERAVHIQTQLARWLEKKIAASVSRKKIR